MRKLWKRALCMATVLAMMMFFCMTVAAQELPEEEGSEEPDYSIEIESGDVTITSNLAGYLAKLEEERLAAEAAAQDAEKMKEELSEEIKNATEAIKGATDEATGAINDALGSFEDGTEWWRTADGWITWLENEGAAVIVAVLSILGTIYIGISPILNKVVKSGQRFEGATATADAVAAQTEEIKKQYEDQLTAMRKQNDEIMEQFRQSMEQAQAEARAAQERCDATLLMMREQYAGVRDDVQRLQRREGDLARMIMIGFGEDEELVRRGSAAKIAEIGGAIEDEQGEKA